MRRGEVTVEGSNVPAGFARLFDGQSLSGWQPIPRVYGAFNPGGPSLAEVMAQQGVQLPQNPERHPAVWTVEKGAIVGRQDAPGSGFGGYLVTEQSFRDFELVVEAKPDWPADTGIVLRRQADSGAGVQVLLDHRPRGGIGGFFGNGLANFSALPFRIDADRDRHGRVTGLRVHDGGTTPGSDMASRRAQLRFAATVEEFLAVWRFGDWNHFRIICTGELPVVTTWINGVRIAELDTADVYWPGYDAEVVRGVLSGGGQIALEVHDNDPSGQTDRWGRGAACRWRDIEILKL